MVPRLETERLVLRRFTPADVEPLFSLMRDREVNTFLPWFPLETEADAAKYLEEHYLDYYRRPSGCRYAVCLRENDRPIGYLHVDDGESHDLGYALARPSWGRGYMTEAAAAVVERLRADGLPFLTATPRRGQSQERGGHGAHRHDLPLLLRGAVAAEKPAGHLPYVPDGFERHVAHLPGLLGPLAPPLGLKSALAICGKACYSCHRKVCTTKCWGAGWNPAES